MISRKQQVEKTLQEAHEILQQRADELAALYRITQLMASTLDLQPLLKAICQELVQIFKASSTGIALLNSDGTELTILAEHLTTADITSAVGTVFPLDDALAASAPFSTGQLDVIPQAQTDPRTQRIRQLLHQRSTQCLMIIPLLSRSRTIGIVTVDTEQANRMFTTAEVNLAKTIAGQITEIIENARLVAEERRQHQIAESLQEVAAILNASLDQNAVLSKIIEQLQRFISYDSAVILLRDADDLVISDLIGLPNPEAIGYRISLTSNSPAVRTFHSQEPMAIANVQKDPGWVTMEGSKPIHSWMGIPLMSGQNAIGVLTINSIEVNAFSESDVRLVTTFANHATIAIENARLYSLAQEAREEANRANRAKSSFLANMSHELRTPLNAIIGFAQIIARSPTLPVEHQENIGIISRSGEHLLALINQVLDLSKIEAGHITLNETNSDLDHLLTDLENMFALKAEEKGLYFLLKRDNDVPRFVHTDEVKLRQILINLLNNAIKFTKEGGVTLRVTLNSEKPAIIHQPPATSLNFEVTDTGPGVATDEMDTLFEAFAQTETGRQAQEGTGLGLPISRKFVQLMGGGMEVDSKVGLGTTFKFDIRVKVVQTGEAQELKLKKLPGIIGLAPNQPRYRLLIVDDNPTSRQLLNKLLAPLGFDLREAENGQQAVEIWETFEPHLIWMDMRMPVMDGYEATRQIKATTKGQATAIIALTASSFEDERTAILTAGCDNFLLKPFREVDIFEMLSRHVGVKYIYEEGDQTTTVKDSNAKFRLDDLKSGLTTLPAELLAQLRDGLVLGDILMIDTVIAEIQLYSPLLAEGLTELTDNIEYDKILRLIEEIEA